MDAIISFGEWVRQRRKALDLTQIELAQRVGCTESMVRKIEADVRRPSKQVAEQLAAALEIADQQHGVFCKVARGELAVMRLNMLVAGDGTSRLARAVPTPEAQGQRRNGVHLTNMLAPPTPLIGRAEEVEMLKTLLQRDNVRLVTLMGSPGVGKTRLALAVAEALVPLFPDGVWLISLDPVVDATLVLAAIARTLKIADDHGQMLVNRITAFLRYKQALLVLDNVEHVIAAAPLLGDLLVSSPQVRMLATSREALRLSGEHRYVVPPLAVPDLRRLPPVETLRDYAAVRLFTERAKATVGDFTLTATNAAAVTAICAGLDGLPLAIELAATRCGLFTPEVLLARLHERSTLLDHGLRDLPLRQQTLHATIAWSYDLLTTSEQQLFIQLAVFMGGWTLEAFAAVCGSDMINTLNSLVDKSLVQTVRHAEDELRFLMLRTVRAFVLELLHTSVIANEVRQNHAAYYLTVAETIAKELRSEAAPAWLDRLRDEHNNFLAALEWTVAPEGNAPMGLHMAGALWPAWLTSGYVSEGRQWLRRVLAATSADGQTAAHARALYGLGALTAFQGDHHGAGVCYEQSLTISSELGDQQQRAWVLTGLGRVAWFRGDHERAVRLYQESWDIFRTLDDSRGSAQALDYLGDAAWQHNDHATALSRYRSSLALYHACGDWGNSARVLGILASIVTFLSDYDQAETFYQECKQVCQRYGDQRGMLSTLFFQSTTLWLQGRYDRATKLLLERLDLCRELDDLLGIAESLHRLGDVVRDQGDLARAAALLQESVRSFRELDDQGRAAWALNGLGDVVLCKGDITHAIALYEESLDVLRTLGDAWGTAVVLGGLGSALQRQGNYHQATQRLNESLEIARMLTFDQAAAWALIGLGAVADATGDVTQALACYVDALPVYQVRGEVPGMIACLEGLALAVSRRDNQCASVWLWGLAASLRESIGAARQPIDQSAYAQAIAAARAQLGEPAFGIAWEEGRTLSIQEAVQQACAVPDMQNAPYEQ